GSVYMALREALMEEQEFRRLPPRLSHALVHKFPSMLEYKSPTTLDMPEVITELVENPDPRGPFGAKEVGQGPLLPVMPAVANAVYDAIGVRIDEVPITPEKIIKALEAAEMLASGDAMLVAGGTDLLPNMKRRQQVPRTLVGLRRVAELRDVSHPSTSLRAGGELTIGAGVTLTELVRHDEVRAKYA